MKALHIVRYGKMPQIKEIPIPSLTNDSVLVKMAYAPINPSDIFFFQGFYGIRKEGFPIVGFEGSGTIIDCKKKQLIGKKVTMLANNSNGTFATHMVTNLADLTIWPNEANLQQICTSIINPWSCIAMCNIVRLQNPTSVILSAAGSSLCRMLIKKLTLQKNIKNVIGMTRNKTYNQQLIKLGCKKVLQLPPTENDAKQISLLQKTVYLDCLGGPIAGNIFNYLPANSLMINYGRLSKQNLADIDTGGLYYKNKVIRGFWLVNYLNSIKQQQLDEIKNEVVSNFNSFYSQKIRKIYNLEQFQQAFSQSIKDQSSGKILLKLS